MYVCTHARSETGTDIEVYPNLLGLQNLITRAVRPSITLLYLMLGSDQHESSPGQSSEELNSMESFPQSATFTAVEDQTCHSTNTASTTHTESANGVQQGECYMLLPAPLIYTPDGRQVDIPAVRELLQPV